MKSLFHLAINVSNLQIAREFYGELLGCEEGRNTQSRVDFNSFGHPLSLHLGPRLQTHSNSKVDSDAVPMPHFGVLLPYGEGQSLADRLQKEELEFIVEPTLRLPGQVAEPYTMFSSDPLVNPINVKDLKDFDTVFYR